jgi:regulation of enolase protein 1 (concanavalin A-like superfamily)
MKSPHISPTIGPLQTKLHTSAALLFALLCATNVQAQPSAKSYPVNPFKAPLYWDTYEYNIKVDDYIPENEWAANIDWVEKNLKPYGYNMIAIDGWGDDQKFNQDGYRTTHSSKWTHDFAWWSDNLKKRGMTLGIYNNPLWVIKTAADAGVKIKGTNIPLKSIMNEKEGAKWFNWVQVDRPGAEEYVKGYVQFYADMGVKYLRVDFLGWFEAGLDRNYTVKVGPERPVAHYETALRWMREACDKNGMMLSLVMPNLNDEAHLEQKYGHMIRINEDAGTGGWERWRNFRKGVRLPGWSQYANAVDGLTYWSYIAGRGKMILDPDFLRINTFANDEERKSVVSLSLMAGGPVTVSDQYNTIGNHLWVYQNREMLALNEDGFVGHPITNDPNEEESQIWRGQMRNGDWVVGFFNHEDQPRVRSIQFTNLGLKGRYYVRDLWQHSDLGQMAAFSTPVPAHGCVIVKISNQKPTQTSSPVFSRPSAFYTMAQTVALSSTTPGATIHYTLDGTEPTSASTVYRHPLQLKSNTTLKARARAANLKDSRVTSAIYNFHLPTSLPAPWQTGDIGAVGAAGSSASRGTSFSLAGSGSDIEGTADAFRFIYQPITGNVTLTAKVTSLSQTNEWAKAGLMIRQGLTADAKNAFVGITPSNGVAFQARDAPGATTQIQMTRGLATPVWLRIARQGDQISTFHSLDGVKWEPIGTATTVSLGERAYIGMAMTSHQSETLGIATFDQVNLSRP